MTVVQHHVLSESRKTFIYIYIQMCKLLLLNKVCVMQIMGITCG